MNNLTASKTAIDPLLVLHYPTQHDGVAHYRQGNPMRALAEMDGVAVAQIQAGMSEEQISRLVESANVLFLLGGQAGLPGVIADARRRNPKLAIVVDSDDDLTNIIPTNDAYQHFGQHEVKLADGRWLWKHGQKGFDLYRNWQRILEYRWVLRQADVVTTTTERLAAQFREMNDVVAVLPNGLFLEDFPDVDIKRRANELHILWSGGSSHFEDLMSVKKSLVEILERNAQVHLHVAGQAFAGFVEGFPPERIHLHRWVHPSGQGFRLATINADIGICPLIDNPFNHTKSCLKFYEYAAVGVATVASAIPPYADEIVTGKTGMLSTPASFGQDIQKLIDDPLKRLQIAGEGQQWVRKHRDIRTIAQDYLEVFRAASAARKDA